MALTGQAIIDMLLRSYIPLRQLDDNGRVVGSCSGCLVRYAGSRFLLTATHSVQKYGRWAVEIRFDVQRQQTELHELGEMNFLKSGDICTGAIIDVDFAYRRVPEDLKPLLENVLPSGQITEQSERLEFTTRLETLPNSDLTFGFCGQSQVTTIGNRAIESTVTIEGGMRYLRTDGDLHVFRLNKKHPGHNYYKGCSGAPILDSDGEVVALLIEGHDTEDAVSGVALQKYRSALTVELLQSGCDNL